MLGNQVELWETLLACMKLRAVVIPATPLLGPADLDVVGAATMILFQLGWIRPIAIDPSELRGLLHLAEAARTIGASARSMVWPVEEGEEGAPAAEAAAAEADEAPAPPEATPAEPEPVAVAAPAAEAATEESTPTEDAP